MSRIEKIARDPLVRQALDACQQETAEAMELAVRIQQIPAPTFGEAERAAFVETQFQQLGLEDVEQDEIHNVYGRYLGLNSAPPVVITAHTDTVFPIETDLTVRFENGRKAHERLIYGPGLADNSLGVAGLLFLAKTLSNFGLRPAGDLWFVANVGEEGLGDLCGMRAVVDRFGPAGAYLVVEGGSYGHIFHEAIGVQRYRLEVHAEGGHSWGDFGRASAIHVLSRIVASFEDLPLPDDPKTTYNVGLIEGGTTVNTIAASASCLLDLRSIDPQALEQLVLAVRRLVQQAGRDPEITSKMTQIGNRPPGKISRRAKPVKWAADALRLMGCKKVSFMAGSTDANVPISLGYPSVCIGLVKSGNTHRLDEYVEARYLPNGLGQLLLLSLAAAGYGS